MFKNNKKLIVILSSSIVVLLLGSYLSRGWIRESFLPNGPPSYFAKQSLDKAHQKAVNSISQSLAGLGLSFQSKWPAACNLFAADGLQTEVSCYVSSWGEKEITNDYIAFFSQNSVEVEDKILENKWTKIHNIAQPINELFNDPDNDVTVAVNYVKNYGKNTCTLSMSYNAFEKDPSKLHYYLTCYRSIFFLGDPDA